ncbi:MAG TPA: CBS domain-containing protein [Anaerolineales bacterium]|nr:CBS domain-containing protein [Anaerolineales bacterium]
MKKELVKDWMTPNPITVTPETNLPEAHKIMKDNRIRRLPVVQDGQLVGIVTRGDIRGAEPSEATSLSIFELHYLVGKLTLDRIMTKNPVTVSPNTTIQDAANLMLNRKISGLPVVEDDRLMGIITESDIFRLVVKMWDKEDQKALEVT